MLETLSSRYCTEISLGLEFGHPIIKIRWEKFGLLWLIEFLEQTLHVPLRRCKMEFWAKFKPETNQIVERSPYSVFGKWKWIVKAKSVSLFRNTPTLTLKLIENGLLVSPTNTWFSKTRVIFFLWKPINRHRTQKMAFWPRYNDLFTKCLTFSLIYFQIHIIFLNITPSMVSLHILVGPFFYIFTRQS